MNKKEEDIYKANDNMAKQKKQVEAAGDGYGGWKDM